MAYILHFDTPIGRLGLVANDRAITRLLFEGETCEAEPRETDILRAARAELNEYFAGKRNTFTIPLDPGGTPFQQRAWQALIDIPYGETRTYAEVARSIDRPTAYRAVGRANNTNPIPIIIPCHRVIGTNGQLTGYRGGLEAKALLIELEGTGVTASGGSLS